MRITLAIIPVTSSEETCTYYLEIKISLTLKKTKTIFFSTYGNTYILTHEHTRFLNNFLS